MYLTQPQNTIGPAAHTDSEAVCDITVPPTFGCGSLHSPRSPLSPHIENIERVTSTHRCRKAVRCGRTCARKSLTAHYDDDVEGRWQKDNNESVSRRSRRSTCTDQTINSAFAESEDDLRATSHYVTEPHFRTSSSLGLRLVRLPKVKVR